MALHGISEDNDEDLVMVPVDEMINRRGSGARSDEAGWEDADAAALRAQRFRAHTLGIDGF